MSTSRAIVTINTPADRDQIARWARNVDWGTVVEFKKKTRSTEQNAKMHAMLSEVSDQVVWYGRKLSVEDWKNIFSASLRKAQVVPGIDPGTVVPLGIHTSTMTIDEMSNMIELIYAFGADPEHPVTFREPQEEKPTEPHDPDTGELSPHNEASDPAPSPAAPDDDGLSAPSPADTPSNEPAGDISAPAGSAIPEKEIEVLKRFAKSVLSLASKPDTSGETMTKVVNRWINIDLVNVHSDEGRAAVKSIHGSVKAIMAGNASYEAAVEFHAEGLGCEPAELMMEVNGNG